MRLRTCLPLIFSILFANCFSQSDNHGIAATHYRGIFWAHRKQILHLEAPTKGIEVSWTKKLGTKKQWHRDYSSPRIGASLTYLNYGLSDITGFSVGILPFAEWVLHETNKSEFNFRIATGIGYINKKWNLRDNNTNKAIGSHFNGNMRLHLIWHRKLIKNLEADMGAGITHYSNGNFSLPNLGINSVEFFLGLTLFQKERKQNENKRSNPDEKSRATDITVAMGTKETDLIFLKRVFPFAAGAKFMWKPNNKNRWGLGLDYFADKHFVYADNAPVKKNYAFDEYSEAGFKLCHETLMGKFGIITDVAFYLYRPGTFKGLFYQRVGIKYNVSPSWHIFTTLKTHFFRADFIEWGIGYSILH